MKNRSKLLFMIGGVIFLGIVGLLTFLIEAKKEEEISSVMIENQEYFFENYQMENRFTMQILEDFVSLTEEQLQNKTFNELLPSVAFRLIEEEFIVSIYLSDQVLEDNEDALMEYIERLTKQESREIRASGVLTHHRHPFGYLELFDEQSHTIIHVVCFSTFHQLTMVSIEIPESKKTSYEEVIKIISNSITVK